MNKSKFMTYFLSLAAAILLLFALFHIGDIKNAFMSFFSALEPLWVGIAFAYLLVPVAAFFERLINKSKRLSRYARPVSVLITSLLVVAAALRGAAAAADYKRLRPCRKAAGNAEGTV